jgi:UPF0716 protein FxsA
MLFILFIVWVAAELFVIVRVAEAIGVLLTIVLLIAAWPLGGWAMRTEGRVVWRHFSAALAEGRPPGREMIEGALVALGGLLLMVPGFISDVFGLLLLFPPTRMLVGGRLVRRIQHRLVARAGRSAAGARPGRGPEPASDVEGTATEIDPPQLRP